MPSILSGHVLIQRVTAKNAIAKRFGWAPSGLRSPQYGGIKCSAGWHFPHSVWTCGASFTTAVRFRYDLDASKYLIVRPATTIALFRCRGLLLAAFKASSR
jgi:hypothetical protein